MCGLAGLFTTDGTSPAALRSVANGMAASLRHRGPDDQGVWADEEGGIALAFRRLSIMDLSMDGHQPMLSRSGRYVLVFNGEIYNFLSLRDQLVGLGHSFRGTGDTEVLVTAIEEWGITGTLPKLNGMFSLGVWDRRERELHLVRDRLGIKPLFVYQAAGCVAFGSEIKALHSLPNFDSTLDTRTLGQFLRYLYVPAPGCIYRNVMKLLPGHVLTIRDPDEDLPASSAYWSLKEVAQAGLNHPFEGTEDEAVRETDRLIRSSVQSHLRADVPLGAFLSGGIDSSLVVALMQEESDRATRTYTVAFEEQEWNEADRAEQIAVHLGTDHNTITMTARDALDVVPQLPVLFDEPFASPSALPNHLLCKAAGKEVTVALAGTGGDEGFWGYNRYTYGERVMRPAVRLPRSVRRGASWLLNFVSEDRWDGIYGKDHWPGVSQVSHIGRKLHKLGGLLQEDSVVSMYRSLVSAWDVPGEILAMESESAGTLERVLNSSLSGGGLTERCVLADQLTYLPDDELAKIDRVSMAVGLEVRVPLLDHRILEWSWRLQSRHKRRRGQGKWILREVLDRYVPRALVDGPKMGLSVPTERWLRGPLKDWGDDLLSHETLQRHGYLRPEAVQAAWSHFQSKQSALDGRLWAVLMLQAWLEEWQ